MLATYLHQRKTLSLRKSQNLKENQKRTIFILVTWSSSKDTSMWHFGIDREGWTHPDHRDQGRSREGVISQIPVYPAAYPPTVSQITGPQRPLPQAYGPWEQSARQLPAWVSALIWENSKAQGAWVGVEAERDKKVNHERRADSCSAQS